MTRLLIPPGRAKVLERLEPRGRPLHAVSRQAENSQVFGSRTGNFFLCLRFSLRQCDSNKGGSLSRSDEGGFGRARQFGRAQPDSRAAAKPTEVGGAASGANRD